jgi:hypothetical protein
MLEEVSYSFHPSNHDKMTYDAMAAAVKGHIRRLARAENLVISGAQEYADVASTVRNMGAHAFDLSGGAWSGRWQQLATTPSAKPSGSVRTWTTFKRSWSVSGRRLKQEKRSCELKPSRSEG